MNTVAELVSGISTYRAGLSRGVVVKSVADLVVDHLVEMGVDYVFGIPGGATIPFHNSLEKHPDINFVLTRHEGGAAFMADCYARVSGRIGVCCATTGPGATNLVTGVAAAYMDSVPMLVITGMNATDTWGRGDFQESSAYGGVDTVQMFRPLCKSSEVIVSEKVLQHRLRTAISTALTGKPGPVHIAVPRDLWGRMVTKEHWDRPRCFRASPSDKDTQEIATLLLSAARPLIVYGSGTSTSALELLFELSRKHAIPIISTPRGKGKGCNQVPENYLGSMGISANTLVDEFLQANHFDVVVSVGAGFGSYATNSWDTSLLRAGTMIQVNIDPRDIGKIFPAHIGVVSDARDFAKKLLGVCAAHGFPTPESRREWLADWTCRSKWDFPPELHIGRGGKPSPMEIIRAVDQAVGDDGIVMADSNSILLWATHHLPERRRRRFISMWGWASMGHATAGAVGAKLAAPESDVVALVGDGCFVMNGNEIATAADLSLPIVWVINANEQLGMIHYELRSSGLTRSATLKNYDLLGLARSLGANAVNCDNPARLDALIRQGLRGVGPTVIQVNVDPGMVPPMGQKKQGAARWKQYVENL